MTFLESIIAPQTQYNVARRGGDYGAVLYEAHCETTKECGGEGGKPGPCKGGGVKNKRKQLSHHPDDPPQPNRQPAARPSLYRSKASNQRVTRKAKKSNQASLNAKSKKPGYAPKEIGSVGSGFKPSSTSSARPGAKMRKDERRASNRIKALPIPKKPTSYVPKATDQRIKK